MDVDVSVISPLRLCLLKETPVHRPSNLKTMAGATALYPFIYTLTFGVAWHFIVRPEVHGLEDDIPLFKDDVCLFEEECRDEFQQSRTEIYADIQCSAKDFDADVQEFAEEFHTDALKVRSSIKAMQQTDHKILHLLHKMIEDARAKNVQYGSKMEKATMQQKY